MAIRLASHLYRNRCGVFYFRAVVPQDLRQSFANREIHRSLRTCDRRDAVARVMILAFRVNAIFQALRIMPKKIIKPIQVDLIESLDLSDLEMGITTWDYDASNSAEVALVEKRRQELLEKVAGRPRVVITAPEPDSKKLSELFELFCKDKRGNKKWKDPVAVEKYDYRPHVAEFIGIVGDKPISTLTAEDARNYRALVLAKVSESMGNKDKRLNRVKTFLNWARQQHHTHKDYAGILKLDVVGKLNESYEPFTDSDLKTLFQSPQYQQATFKKASQYWIPLIGLYMGGRINEIAQLHVADIRKVDGIDAIDINDDGEKTVKNESSIRTVPIHPELRKAGFFDYVELIRKEGHAQLFPELRKSSRAKDSFGKEPSRHFTAYRRGLGVVTEGEKLNTMTGKWTGSGKKAFHSLRTTVISMLRREGVLTERRERLVGHESDGVNNRVYRSSDKDERFKFQMLYDDLCKLVYGLKHPPYSPTDAHRRARMKVAGSRLQP